MVTAEPVLDETASTPEATSLSAHHPVEVPAAGDALNSLSPGVFEGQARTCNEVLHHLGHQYVRRACEGRDPSACMHRDAAHVVAVELDLAGMHTTANLDSELGNGL